MPTYTKLPQELGMGSSTYNDAPNHTLFIKPSANKILGKYTHSPRRLWSPKLYFKLDLFYRPTKESIVTSFISI